MPNDDAAMPASSAQDADDRRQDRPARVPWPAVAVFVALSFGLAWIVALPLWLSGGGLAHPLAGLILPVMMLTPAVATLVTVLLVQRPRPSSVPRYLGLTPLRPAKRLLGMLGIAFGVSVLIPVLGVFLAAAVGAVQLDLVTFSGFRQLLDEQAAMFGAEAALPPVGVIVALQLLMIPLGSIINSFLAFGEELGWRGWLLPSLRPLGVWPALLLSGAIWGLWHSPVILLGYNFGEPNLLGVLAMVGGCTAFGVVIGWLRLRSASVWPAVFAHGAFNAAAGFGALVLAAGSEPHPFSILPLGWPGWVVCALIVVVLVLTGQFRKEPVPGVR